MAAPEHQPHRTPSIISAASSALSNITRDLHLPAISRERLYLAAYYIQGQQTRFHWALWMEGKRSEGAGHAFDVKLTDRYANVPGSGGWKYESRGVDARESRAMLGRMRIGKLPRGVGVAELDVVLAELPVPRENSGGADDPAGTCRTWIMAALWRLQELGWVDRFSVKAMVDEAHRLAREWLERDPLLAGTRDRTVKQQQQPTREREGGDPAGPVSD